MARLGLAASVVLLAACSTDLTLETDRWTYLRSDRGVDVELTLRNHSSVVVESHLCDARLEHHSQDIWTVIPSADATVCAASFHHIAPLRQAKRIMFIPPSVVAGTYRYVTASDLSGPGSGEVVVSQPFELLDTSVSSR